MSANNSDAKWTTIVIYLLGGVIVLSMIVGALQGSRNALGLLALTAVLSMGIIGYQYWRVKMGRLATTAEMPRQPYTMGKWRQALMLFVAIILLTLMAVSLFSLSTGVYYTIFGVAALGLALWTFFRK